MYSPKISEELIPVLYRLAKKKGLRMTTLVNQIINREIRKEERRNGRLVDSSGREPVHYERRT